MAGELRAPVALSAHQTQRGTDYARLSRQVRQAGLLDRRTGHYAWRITITVGLLLGGWLTDLALGGLNYQIEHHLFPSMPRPSLRRSQALISDFCRQEGLPYCETSLVRSYAQALGYLNADGRQATKTT